MKYLCFPFVADLAKCECPEPYEEIEDRCFMFVDRINTNYIQARDICLDAGADLPVLSDCNILAKLTDYISNYSKFSIIIMQRR